MAIRVKIPTPLRKLTDGVSTVNVEGNNIEKVISNLESEYPGILERLCDENGQLRAFVNIFVNGEDIRYLSGMESAITDGDEISIVPAVAGG